MNLLLIAKSFTFAVIIPHVMFWYDLHADLRCQEDIHHPFFIIAYLITFAGSSRGVLWTVHGWIKILYNEMEMFKPLKS